MQNIRRKKKEIKQVPYTIEKFINKTNIRPRLKFFREYQEKTYLPNFLLSFSTVILIFFSKKNKFWGYLQKITSFTFLNFFFTYLFNLVIKSFCLAQQLCKRLNSAKIFIKK